MGCQQPRTFMATSSEELQLRNIPAGEGFSACARLIARDIQRTFPGYAAVDNVRLRAADVLRSYAQKDAELGYTQGMCFVAVAVCLHGAWVEKAPDEDAEFAAIIQKLRGFWLPGFPLVAEGIDLLEVLLDERDPDLLAHFRNLGVDLLLMLPQAWLSLFAKWLPMASFLELLPFISQNGLHGVITVTYILILYHRWFIMGCQEPHELLAYMSTLSMKPPPKCFLRLCSSALPKLAARLAEVDSQ